jgi:hypothetical protein
LAGVLFVFLEVCVKTGEKGQKEKEEKRKEKKIQGP